MRSRVALELLGAQWLLRTTRATDPQSSGRPSCAPGVCIGSSGSLCVRALLIRDPTAPAVRVQQRYAWTRARRVTHSAIRGCTGTDDRRTSLNTATALHSVCLVAAPGRLSCVCELGFHHRQEQVAAPQPARSARPPPRAPPPCELSHLPPSSCRSHRERQYGRCSCPWSWSCP